jgi:hypothetical protein
MCAAHWCLEDQQASLPQVSHINWQAKTSF